MSAMVPQPEAYFGQWIPERNELLKALETEAQNEQIPIVGPVVGKLLYILASLRSARHILELGTASGYSAIFLGHACQQSGGRVVTLESNPAMAERARTNIAKARLENYIDVRCQDALDALQDFTKPMDMIFMDIEKADYIRALPFCKRLLAPQGLLVADNTGFTDADAFNQALYGDSGWQMVNLWAFLPGHSPEYDGLCLALKH